jgi:hypothetical protein
MKANLNPLSDAALQLWPEFILSVPSQLEAGKQTYGDQSFQIKRQNARAKWEEELLDVTGWAFVLCVRMKSIRNRIEKESQQCQVQSTK